VKTATFPQSLFQNSWEANHGEGCWSLSSLFSMMFLAWSFGDAISLSCQPLQRKFILFIACLMVSLWCSSWTPLSDFHHFAHGVSCMDFWRCHQSVISITMRKGHFVCSMSSGIIAVP
jgi:hypothetical protein